MMHPKTMTSLKTGADNLINLLSTMKLLGRRLEIETLALC